MIRILLIDDSPYDFEILLYKLIEYEVEIHWTTNIYHGQLYLETLQTFDLVICDVMGVGYNKDEDLKFLNKDTTILTSGSVFMNPKGSFEFIEKEHLAERVIKKLHLNERSRS